MHKSEIEFKAGSKGNKSAVEHRASQASSLSKSEPFTSKLADQGSWECWDELIQLQLSSSGDFLPCDSQRVEMPRKDMEVTMGQMVLLEAWYTPTSAIEKNTIIWSFMANDSKQVISYSSGQIGIGSMDFRQRVGFAMSMPSANLSIFINNTQESDSGRYLCNVIIPGAPGLTGELRLDVK
ncbi:hypothetical protein DNTS_018953, partial [Danionella cerebrum]